MRRLHPTYSDKVDLDSAYEIPNGEPHVRANMVTSADGAAIVDGVSGGLSGTADRALLKRLRTLAGVVLVGAGTVRAEGYASVKPRGASGPRLAIVSRTLDLDLPPAEPEERPIVFTTSNAREDRISALAGRAELVVSGGDTVDLVAAVEHLTSHGHPSILCEGGPGLLGALAAAGLLDELCLTVSPQLRSGEAFRVLSGPGLDPSPRLDLIHVLEEAGFLFLRYAVTR